MNRLLLLFCLLFWGCASPRRNAPAPSFAHRLQGPVAIRMLDRRPELERGNVPDPDWIYFRSEGTRQSDLMVNYLGNALVSLNAAPGYVVVGGDASPHAYRVLIELEYLNGYARWPVDVDQRGNEVSVEGATRISYRIHVDGERVRQGRMSEAPPDFLVPVAIIRESNVRRVVSEALAHQFDKATTDLLDAFLWRVADAWPER